MAHHTVDEDERKRLAAAFRDSLAYIPNCDEQIIAVGERTYSPRQIVEEIECGTPFGLEYYRAYMHGIEGIETFEESLARIRKIKPVYKPI